MTELYNFEQLEKLSGGNKKFITEIVTVFFTEVPKQLEEIKSALKKNDLINVSRLAHKLKPSIDLLNINSISKEIRTIEKLAKENNSNFSNELEKVNTVLSEVISEIKG
jgi:HPt (histidine-containing phosphotransfer) domain-containing protein